MVETWRNDGGQGYNGTGNIAVGESVQGWIRHKRKVDDGDKVEVHDYRDLGKENAMMGYGRGVTWKPWRKYHNNDFQKWKMEVE